MFLNDVEIRRRIYEERLIENFGTLAEQVQPNGFDFRLDEVYRIHSERAILRDSVTKHEGHLQYINLVDETYNLAPGMYKITLMETVNMSPDLLALGRPRSSLIRNGISLHTGVWDAGYSGKSSCLMVIHEDVHQLDYTQIQKGARVMQMVFAKLNAAPSSLYAGSYQFEGLADAYGHEEGA